ncbi:MAG: dTDP-4-amino-4,6-dideoxygalactose transaminase [Alloalcanivorax venustensis]|jgi:dTDP-4-amino-4,6-dideoxygalactose transaminase
MINFSRPNISEQAIDSVVEVLRPGKLAQGSKKSEAFER